MRQTLKEKSFKGEKHVKKGFAILLALGLMFAFAGIAFAADITPMQYNKDSNELYSNAGMNWTQVLNSDKPANLRITLVYTGYDNSTHPQGTWNSPYTAGIDGYNYNDPQDYTEENGYGAKIVAGKYTVGPHGGYLTSTHKCRECHAVHRAAGKFKLTRANTRFEACDWCHGTGAGSGYNIQMDNDDAYTREYNVGHTMGFGVQDGKWKAPDDTYPAFTPNYWLGGFSCFDCHSPHANPARLLGYNDNGTFPVDPSTGKPAVSIANPGHEFGGEPGTFGGSPNKPTWAPGSWLLIKNADREINPLDTTITVQACSALGNVQVAGKGEIKDLYDGNVVDDTFFGFTAEDLPVNKIQTDWDSPIGGNGYTIGGRSATRIWSVSEFCTDCHDGNAGLHTRKAPLFSEDRALRDQASSYDIGYGHDTQPRH